MSRELQFANFILKFGNKNLIDLAEEVVVPAFKLEGLRRIQKKANHFFMDVELVNLGSQNDPVLCIAGRYVKDTAVRREQVFNSETKEIIKDNRTLKTAPSSIFILILNNHRLIYINETSYAPNIRSFKTTAAHFIRLTYNEFIRNSYKRLKDQGVTLKQLHSEYGHPSLNITSLANTASIREFIGNYDLLKSVEITLLKTNNELDNNDFFEEARKSQEEVQADQTIIKHTNGITGLNKSSAAKQVESAIGQGNAQVKLQGVDREGNHLKGNNDSFSIKSQIDSLSNKVPDIAKQGYEKFQILVRQGMIQIGESKENVSDKIKKILDSLDP
jgi:hypothetical protein